VLGETLSQAVFCTLGARHGVANLTAHSRSEAQILSPRLYHKEAPIMHLRIGEGIILVVAGVGQSARSILSLSTSSRFGACSRAHEATRDEGSADAPPSVVTLL
jgi:hypothetical protein